MNDRIFGDREKAMEDAYFRDQDARLLGKLRQRADLDEIAIELGRKFQVDDPQLLLKVKELGITLETASGFFLAPLVEVAWADGRVKKEERSTVLKLARERSIEAGSQSYKCLEQWLDVRPTDEFFATALIVLKAGFSVLPHAEREERIRTVLDACEAVAQASAGITHLFGLDGVSSVEAAILQGIERALRGHD